MNRATTFALSEDITSLQTRALMLMGLVVLMLLAAGAAVLLSKRAVRAHNAKQLEDGSDLSAASSDSGDWYAALRRDED